MDGGVFQWSSLHIGRRRSDVTADVINSSRPWENFEFCVDRL